MTQEAIKKVQILERLVGHLRNDFGWSLEADEIYSVLFKEREKLMPKYDLSSFKQVTK